MYVRPVPVARRSARSWTLNPPKPSGAMTKSGAAGSAGSLLVPVTFSEDQSNKLDNLLPKLAGEMPLPCISPACSPNGPVNKKERGNPDESGLPCLASLPQYLVNQAAGNRAQQSNHRHGQVARVARECAKHRAEHGPRVRPIVHSWPELLSWPHTSTMT